MINQILLNMLIRQIKNGNITNDDIKVEEYKQKVIDELGIKNQANEH